MKKFMKKNKNTVIFVAIIIIILVGLFILSTCLTKKTLQEITYDEYTKLVEEGKDFVVYFGEENQSYDNIKETISTSNATSYFVNTKNLTDEQKTKVLGKEKTSFQEYTNKEKTYSYSDDDYKSYKFTQGLMDNDIIERKYIEVSIDEYLDIIKTKGYNFMFVGSSTCSYCTMFKESVNNALKEKKFNVYYIDLAREDVTDSQREKLYASDKYFTEEEWGTPLNLLYKDGKRIDVLNGYVDKDELISFLQENKVIE